MKNLLKLHEAVAIVLLFQPSRTATFQKIADVIESRNFFPNRKGGIALAEQIKLRTAIKSSKYKHLFEFFPPNKIVLI
jgi:hypothetical protein